MGSMIELIFERFNESAFPPVIQEQGQTDPGATTTTTTQAQEDPSGAKVEAEPTEAGGAYFTLPHHDRPTASLAAAHNAIDAIAPALPNALLHTRPTRQPNPPLAGEINATLDAYVWDHFEIPTLLLNIPYTTSHHTLFTRQEYQRLGATLLQGICAHLQVPLTS